MHRVSKARWYSRIPRAVR